MPAGGLAASLLRPAEGEGELSVSATAAALLLQTTSKEVARLGATSSDVSRLRPALDSSNFFSQGGVSLSFSASGHQAGRWRTGLRLWTGPGRCSPLARPQPRHGRCSPRTHSPSPWSLPPEGAGPGTLLLLESHSLHPSRSFLLHQPAHGWSRSGNRNQLLQATTVRDITPLPQWVRSTTALHTHWPTASLPSDNPSPSHRRWALLSTPREAPTHGASPWHHCSRKTSPGTSSWKDTTNSTTLPLHDNAPFLSSSPSPSGPFQATPAHLPSRSFPRRRESMDQPVINKTPEPSGAGSRAVSPRMITSANSTPPGSRDAPTPLHSCTGTCSHRKRPLR